MATKVAASIKKTAKAASKSSKSVRRSTKISPALAAYSNGLADAVARGGKLGSLATQVAALKAVAAVAPIPKILDAAGEKRARTNAAKRFAGKLAAKKASATKKSRTKKNAKAPVVTVLQMGTPNLPVGDKDPRMDARVRNDQHAKRRSAIRSGSAVRQPYKGWQPTHSVPFEALSLTEREHAILKRAHLLTAQLKRETRDQRAKWNVSPKAYTVLDQYKEGVRAVKGWSVWLWESGWLGGDGASTFHGTSTKPAHGKKDLARERDAQKREAQRRSGVRDGKEQLGFRADFERSETAGKPCVVPNCTGTSRKSFEARKVHGMESADGKAVCRTHGEVLIAISRSSLDWTKKELMVGDLLDHGQEPDPDLLASAKPAQRQAPVRAHAVNPAALTAFIAAGAVLSTPPSGNGNGSAVCTFCGNPASVKEWAFKVPANVRLELIELAVDEPVCRDCGAGLYHLGGGKVAKDEQPTDVAGVIAWAEKAKEHFSKRGGNPAPAPKQVAHVEPALVQAAPSADKKPCPVPGCKLVLLKVNPFKSQVLGMEAANGIAFCGAHVKELARIAHMQVAAEQRAELVNAILHPMSDEQFELVVARVDMEMTLEPTGELA